MVYRFSPPFLKAFFKKTSFFSLFTLYLPFLLILPFYSKTFVLKRNVYFSFQGFQSSKNSLERYKQQLCKSFHKKPKNKTYLCTARLRIGMNGTESFVSLQGRGATHNSAMASDDNAADGKRGIARRRNEQPGNAPKRDKEEERNAHAGKEPGRIRGNRRQHRHQGGICGWLTQTCHRRAKGNDHPAGRSLRTDPQTAEVHHQIAEKLTFQLYDFNRPL